MWCRGGSLQRLCCAQVLTLWPHGCACIVWQISCGPRSSGWCRAPSVLRVIAQRRLIVEGGRPCRLEQVLVMSVVNFFLNSHSWTPEGVSKVFWVSMASLLDIGQVPSTKGAGSHIVSYTIYWVSSKN